MSTAISSPLDLAQYQGINGKHHDPKKQAVLLENSTFSRNVYRPGTVDYVLFDQAYVLSKDTQAYFYSDAYPQTCGYVKGTRIHLEQLVDSLIAHCTTQREQALAILKFVRDIPVNYFSPSGDVFHGGSEEEVIRKGSSMCNEQARVLIVMAQIAGIPARYIGHMTEYDFDDPKSGSGHGVAELCVDGKWAYMDIRGIYFEKENSELASTWEVIEDPSLIDKQAPHVSAFIKSDYSYANSKKYFSDISVHIVAPYNVEDHGNYDYSWVYPSASAWNEAREKARAIRCGKHKDLLPQPVTRM